VADLSARKQTTTIVETDAELKNLAFDEVSQQERDSDDETPVIESSVKDKSI